METTESINLDLIKKEPGLKEEVLEVYKYLDIYKNSEKRKDWVEKRKKNWDAISENKMTSEKDLKELEDNNMDDLVINKSAKGVQGASAIVTDKKPDMKFLPIGSSDLYAAELMKRGNDVIWEKNQGNDVVYDCVEECKISGLTWVSVVFNENKGMFGRIEFEEEPSDDIYFSAKSRRRDFSDTHIMKAKLRTLSYIKKEYPDLDTKDILFGQELAKGEEDDPDKSSSVEGEDAYTTGSEPSGDDGKGLEPANIWEIEAYMLDMAEKDFYAYVDDNKNVIMCEIPEQGEEDKKPRAEFIKSYIDALKTKYEQYEFKHVKRNVEIRDLRIIIGKHLYYQEENPLGTDADGDPILGLIGLKHDRTRHAYPTCPTDKAIPINREKNKRRAQFILGVSQNANSPLAQWKGLTEWTGNPGTPGSYADVDTKAPSFPTRIPAGSMDMHKYVELEQLADKDIDDVYDLHDVMRGKIPPGQSNIAGRTVLALQDMGGVMSKPFLRKLEGFLVRLSRAYMALAFKHWTRQMWVRLIEDEEMEGWEDQAMIPVEERNAEKTSEIAGKWLAAIDKISPIDAPEGPAKRPMSMLDVDVKVISGSSMPTNRMAKQAVAVDMMKVGAYDAEAVLDYTDDPNKDKIKQRLAKQKEEEMQMAAMKGKK